MKVNFWTALVVLVVGLYDFLFAIDRQRKTGKPSWSFYVLGTIFVIGGFVLILQNWIG